jgi:hypothetical protein
MRPWFAIRAGATAIAATLVLAGSACAGSVAPGSSPARQIQPTGAPCPPLPADAATLSVFVVNGPANPAALVVPCFGRREIMVSAYVPRDVAIDGTWSPQIAPVWLMPSGIPQAVIAASPASSGFGVRVPPRLQRCVGPTPTTYPGCPFAALAGRVVEVRGHFDDLAARTCHYLSPPPPGWPSPAALVASCRQEFVVDSVTALDQAPPRTDAEEPGPTTSPGPLGLPVLGLVAVLGVTLLWLASSRPTSAGSPETR